MSWFVEKLTQLRKRCWEAPTKEDLVVCIADVASLLVELNEPLLGNGRAREIAWEFGKYEAIVRRKRTRMYRPPREKMAVLNTSSGEVLGVLTREDG